VSIEPYDAARRRPPYARVLGSPTRLTDQVRALVDGALDRVFDEPLDIRSDADFLRVILEPASNAGRTGTTASALAGFVTMMTPFAERALRMLRTGGKAPLPGAKAAKYAAIAVPIGVQLSATVRRGVREIQAIASYLVHEMRLRGIEPDRDVVRGLTLSLYLDPDRRPHLAANPRRIAASLSRVWIFRALGTDSEQHRRRRGEAWIDAVARLDLASFTRGA
jgi:hypothetical protein